MAPLGAAVARSCEVLEHLCRGHEELTTLLHRHHVLVAASRQTVLFFGLVVIFLTFEGQLHTAFLKGETIILFAPDAIFCNKSDFYSEPGLSQKY